MYKHYCPACKQERVIDISIRDNLHKTIFGHCEYCKALIRIAMRPQDEERRREIK